MYLKSFFFNLRSFIPISTSEGSQGMRTARQHRPTRRYILGTWYWKVPQGHGGPHTEKQDGPFMTLIQAAQTKPELRGSWGMRQTEKGLFSFQKQGGLQQFAAHWDNLRKSTTSCKERKRQDPSKYVKICRSTGYVQFVLNQPSGMGGWKLCIHERLQMLNANHATQTQIQHEPQLTYQC